MREYLKATYDLLLEEYVIIYFKKKLNECNHQEFMQHNECKEIYFTRDKSYPLKKMALVFSIPFSIVLFTTIRMDKYTILH